MSEFVSFFGVIALWIGVSLAFWWGHQRARGAGERERLALARLAESRVAEAAAVFDRIRGGPAGPERGAATHVLLRRIQEQGSFFDGVSALRPRIERVIGEACEPLAEILHVRRDLWAASEIALAEDFRALGPDFAEGDHEPLRAEAMRLLFLDVASASAEEDLIHLRLALALGEARQLVVDVEEAIRLRREHERLPTASEAIAYPIAAMRAMPRQIRSARQQAGAFAAQVSALASAIRQSQAMTQGLSALAHARAELPQRVVAGLDKASVAARQGAASVKGHYEFLAAAYDFQARYAELVRRAPEVTERGRQFIARLELAEKSERLKLTSATLREASRRLLMRGLAHAIAGLQRLLAALEARHAAARAAAAAAPPSRRDKARTVNRGTSEPPKRAAPEKKPSQAAVRGKTASGNSATASAPFHRSAATNPEPSRKAAKRAAKPDKKDKTPKSASTGKAPAEAAKPAAAPRPAPKTQAVTVSPPEPAKPVVASPSMPPRTQLEKATGSGAASTQKAPDAGKTSRGWWRREKRRSDVKTAIPAPAAVSPPASRLPAASVVPPPAGQPPAEVRTSASDLEPASLAQDAAPVPADKAPGGKVGSPPEPRPSLAARLTGIASVDLAPDLAENAEDAGTSHTESEDDDPGELTRSILEAHARQTAKPGRSPGRAFPWLRR